MTAVTERTKELRQWLVDNKADFCEIDGQFHRDEKDRSVWAKATRHDLGDGTTIFDGYIGDFADQTALKTYQDPELKNLTADQKKKLEKLREKVFKSIDSNLGKMQKEAAMYATKQHAIEGKDLSSHKYYNKRLENYRLESKDLKVYNTSKGKVLALFGRNADGDIQCIQSIFESGEKLFYFPLTIGSVTKFNPKGSFVDLGTPHQGKATNFILCEGIATAAAIFHAHKESTKNPHVICCFTAGNLEPVAKALKEKYKSTEFIIACDNDFKENDKNPGLFLGSKAAKAASGTIRYPSLGPKTSCDYDDLFRQQGPGAVLDSFYSLPDIHNRSNWELIKSYFPWRSRSDGKGTLKPTDSEVSDYLAGFLKDDYRVDSDVLFKWNKNHWKQVDLEQFEQFLIAIIKKIMSDARDTNNFRNSTVSGTLKLIPKVKRGTFFERNPSFANFLNGTLVYNKTSKTFSMKDHDKLDYINYVFPMKYISPEQSQSEQSKLTNKAFHNFLDKLFKDDPYYNDKIESIRQLLGACFFPIHPQTWCMYGPAHSGKSTIIKVVEEIIGSENTSHLDFHQFKGFSIYRAFSKTLNVFGDYDTTQKMPQVLKSADAREKVLGDRKNKEPIEGVLPPIMLMSGNAKPMNDETESDAWERRMTFLKCYTYKATNDPEKMIVEDLINKILNSGSGAEYIAQWAVEGIREILSGQREYIDINDGSYQEWKVDNNPIYEFKQRIEEGSSDLKINPTAEVEMKLFRNIVKQEVTDDLSTYERRRYSVLKVKKTFLEMGIIQEYRTEKSLMIKGLEYEPRANC